MTLKQTMCKYLIFFHLKILIISVEIPVKKNVIKKSKAEQIRPSLVNSFDRPLLFKLHFLLLFSYQSTEKEKELNSFTRGNGV